MTLAIDSNDQGWAPFREGCPWLFEISRSFAFPWSSVNNCTQLTNLKFNHSFLVKDDKITGSIIKSSKNLQCH